MKIRKAVPEDLKVVHGLIMELFGQERETWDLELKSPGEVSDYYNNLLGEKLSEEYAVIYLAEENDQACGFALAYILEDELHTYNDKAYIRTIYVKPGFRKTGVGTLLIEKILGWARDLKAECAEADAYAENKEGLAFWEHAGFKPKFTLVSRKI
ncbi:MAG: GNAT family N-acetyltransferase [Methanobacteriota archaeon]